MTSRLSVPGFVRPLIYSALAVFSLDLLTKAWAIQELPGHSRLVGEHLVLALHSNPGFSWWANLTGIWAVLAGLTVAVMLAVLLRRAFACSHAMGIALAIGAGGYLGNVVDLLLNGAVTDWLVFPVQQTGVIVNLADLALLIAIIGLLATGLPRLFQGESPLVPAWLTRST